MGITSRIGGPTKAWEDQSGYANDLVAELAGDGGDSEPYGKCSRDGKGCADCICGCRNGNKK